MGIYSDLSFVNVTKDSLRSLLNKAKKRIIFAKPAFNDWEIDLILNLRKEKDIYCELYLESNDESIRFGFGEMAALKKITEQIDKLTIQIVNRIRLAILIVDDETLIYSPEIVFIDDDLMKSEFPSGVFGGENLTKKIIELFPPYMIDTHDTIDLPTDIFEIPVLEKKHKEIVLNQINKTIVKLEETPPVNPSNLRKVYFYKNKYKLLKYELHGTKIQNKKLNLNPFIKLLVGQNERLKSSWTIFSKDDLDGLKDMILFEEEFLNVSKEYLVDIGRFGYLIPIEKKKEFDEKVKKLKEDFVAYIKNEATNDNIFLKISKGKSDIKATLNSSKRELINHLISTSKGSEMNIINQNRHLFNMVTEREMDELDALKKSIEEIVDNKLKFPFEQEIIDRINVRIDYYDISDELLYENEDFIEILRKENLLEENLRENKEGMEVQLL